MKKVNKEEKHRGIFTKLKILLEQNRLGELMVLSGLLTSRELRHALKQQKAEGKHLGHILIQKKLISRKNLYRTLAQQWALRGLTAIVTIFITFSSFGGVKNARAAAIKDVPAQMSLVSTANSAFTPVRAYPSLFGSAEKRSGNLAPFTKWTSMFKRFDAAMNQPQGQKVIKRWQKDLKSMQGLSISAMAKKVNTLINAEKYISDSRNWGKGDYWETPIEFFNRGGDCEDFAIAKYASLRALGVPEERLRIAIVHDEQKDIPHAVLVVYAEEGAYILDNQEDRTLPAASVTHYRPIFSINRNAWWLHTRPSTTIIASAK